MSFKDSKVVIVGCGNVGSTTARLCQISVT